MEFDVFNPDEDASSVLAVVDAKGDLLVGQANDTIDNLGVGADGTVLTADSAQALGVKWATPDVTQAELDAEVATRAAADTALDNAKIDKSIVDAKGDLIVATAADTPARLPVGADGLVLGADSTTATGLKWIAGGGGGGGGTSDHGLLTGLGDDDHPQYHNDARGDARYWQLTTDLATQAELDAHLNDAVDAHDASAVSVLDAGLLLTATDVEAALAEIQTNVNTDVAALAAHLADAVDAHDASAVSIVDSGGYYTGTEVEAALQEIAATDALKIPKSLVDAKGDLLTATANDTPARLAVGTDGQLLVADSAQASGIKWATVNSGVVAVIDGGGATITTGQKGHIEVPFACVITAVRLFADVSGSIVVDIWKDTYANFPPTVADTITAAAKPTLSSAQKSQDTTLTGWTTTLNAGDILAFNVDSVSTVGRVTLSLSVRRT